MKTSFKAILALLLTAIVVGGCSRKKDSFVSRNFHAVATEYNVLFNGYNALENGRKALNESYEDDYWEILPIERMQITDEIVLPGQSKNSDFEKAEEKAVKAIQKHGMNIKGKEKNPQIDEAYLLLGKARYFDERFVPALEAFNYILYKYPASDKINQAKIWREKTNIRLENDELAISNLKRLLRQEELVSQDLADATSMLAQAYINTKSLDSAVWQLEIAANATKSNDERGRYRIIQGQLYNELGKRDSANYAFDRVIELHRKTPRIYFIAAHVGKSKNFDIETGDKVQFLELLSELEENRENRPYLDKIYHQIAEYHLADSSLFLAEDYYKRALSVDSRDKHLMALCYEELGNMNFDYHDYKVAGAYYDSTLLNMKNNSKPFRAIKRKRDNLDDVIFYEDIAQRNDSILNLVSLTEEERFQVFSEHVAQLKIKAEEEKQREEIAKRTTIGVGVSPITNAVGMTSVMKTTTFYFYNPTTVSYGKNEFRKIWGQRPLEDNWRWANKATTGTGIEIIDSEIVNATEDELYDPQFYMDRIPNEQTVIDSLSKDRNFAYYQLGLIYKDKFREYKLAENKLESVLKSNPEERLILPSKYNLYKIYIELNEMVAAESVKQDIIANHGDSRYASILLNPNADLGEDENSPEYIYENLFRAYENQEYAKVIAGCETHITTFDGEAIVPKFELLKASSRGRLYGFESFKEAINFIALNYPNSAEGKQAQNMLQSVIPVIEKREFITNDKSNSFKLVYQFENANDETILAFYTKLEEGVKNTSIENITASIDVYNQNTKLVVIHGFTDYLRALSYAEILREKHNIFENSFYIATKNYEIIQIHKTLDIYLKSLLE